MFRNYFKTAFRTLLRNGSYAFINIAGLATGIAVCLTIFLIIQFELSFDTFHTKKDRIYRVITKIQNADGPRLTAGVPFPLPTTLHNDFPNLKSSAVLQQGQEQIIIPDDKTGKTIRKFKVEHGFFFAEPSFFEIFDFPLLAGDWKGLKEPHTALLTKETADQYYGDWKSAIGKTFKKTNGAFYKIIGILAPIPANTDFQIKILASYVTHSDFTESTDWVSTSSDHECYFLLPEGMTQAGFDKQLDDFTKKYKKDNYAKSGEITQSLSEVHYASATNNFMDRTISTKLINTLWFIAGLILLIACVNFINLATAQAINRAKEVAVRKVLGSNRRQLQLQFFGETAMITFAAILLGAMLSYFTLPFIGSILSFPLTFSILHNPVIIVFLLLIGVAIVMMAGFYPALVLSRFNPITALKSTVKVGSTRGISLRRVLVVFQFVIAQALIIATLIILKQMSLFRNQPMGFDREAIVNVSLPEDSVSMTKVNYLKDRLLRIPGVQSVSFSFGSPADDGNWNSNFKFDHAEKETNWDANLKWADADFLKTYNIPLAAGRNIYPADTVREFVVNETFINRLGITDPVLALNKEINLWNGQMKGPIVGVIKDFNALALRKPLVPVIIASQKNFYEKAGIKLDPSEMLTSLKKTAVVWNEVYPDFVYDQKFLDAKIESFYKDETRLSQLYKIFAALAIFLSCLGLYGLSSFMAAQRVKEVGIRKVLGASVNSIILLFSKEFLLLIAIAFVVAAPLAWYYMHNWLQDFIYRVDIAWWILALAGLLAIVVALITVSFQAIKAAIANPVKSLRSE